MSTSFFVGAMSPYAWFAAERMGALLPRARWRPVFAGGLFRACGRTSWGLTDARARGLEDCEARAREHGLGPLVWPDPWPTNDLIVARAMVWAEGRGRLEAFTLAAMRLAFREGGELGELAVVQEAGRRVGLQPAALAEGVASPEVREALQRGNDEAVGLGVFGVPTVVVGDALFWGDDRLEAAAEAAG